MTARTLCRPSELRLTANAPQLSLRDLRRRPLRADIEAQASEPEQSPLEAALVKYLHERGSAL